MVVVVVVVSDFEVLVLEEREARCLCGGSGDGRGGRGLPVRPSTAAAPAAQSVWGLRWISALWPLVASLPSQVHSGACRASARAR